MALNDVIVVGAPARQALERNMLRLDVAEKLAKACFDFSRRSNQSASVHIADQFGHAIYVGRMDGQTSDNIDSARLKAKTAVYFREPTSVWAKLTAQDPLMAIWVHQLGQFAAPGGLPIIVEDQLLGAIGVGGTAENEACAYEALVTVLGPQPSLNGSVEP